MTDSVATDLEAIKARRLTTTTYHGKLTWEDVSALIAEVEALRERMAALGEDNARRIRENLDAGWRAEAAEAQVAELARALENVKQWVE